MNNPSESERRGEWHMEIIRSVSQMQNRSRELRKLGKTIGVVMTMGYLHEGHLSLLRIARPRCDTLVMTLFVNPAQFGPAEDLKAYPRDFERDRTMAEHENVDIIFAPDNNEMYPFGLNTIVDVPEMGSVMCGAFRPGHFRGVTTIVAKLFNAVMPQVAVFGQKDAQQAAIIKRMARDLFFDITIIIGPTVREPDGLAMSSRNVYLNKEERREALGLSKSLSLAEKLIREGSRSPENIKERMRALLSEYPGVDVEYIAFVHQDTLEPVTEIAGTILVAIAARVGPARLIDNIIITV